MSRIYTVRARQSGSLVRYVRAKTLNAAVRAVADELYEAKASTTDEMYQAMNTKTFNVLDAVEPDDRDSEPAPLRAVT